MDKVYVVTNDWSVGVEHGAPQKAFAKLKDARKYIKEQFEKDKEQYLMAHDEDDVVIEESANEASVYVYGEYADEHSDYVIRKLKVE